MLNTGQDYQAAGRVEGIIFDIKRFAIHDGSGIRTTIFFKGCPMHCWWCHNPEGQKKALEEISGQKTIGRRVTVAEVMEEIEKDRIFYDESLGGVTFSGGEPLMQPHFLRCLLYECRRLDIHTSLDTSGYASRRIFNSLLDKADHFLYDLKLMDNDQHIKYTGVSNYWIKENLLTLSKKGKGVTLRFPVIPGITDSDQNINDISEFAASLRGIYEIDLLPFHPMAAGKYRRFNQENRLAGVLPPTGERMEEIKEKFQHHGFKVKIGG